MNSRLLAIIDTYQNSMESHYQETSMLTNLFVENKFWGWFGLTTIVICLGIFFWSFYPND